MKLDDETVENLGYWGMYPGAALLMTIWSTFGAGVCAYAAIGGLATGQITVRRALAFGALALVFLAAGAAARGLDRLSRRQAKLKSRRRQAFFDQPAEAKKPPA
ncbi:MAG: hypothetical protein CFE28_02095 [Alphaproteobacteria bacterium PA2]|nr:MAG: hypothetical protein CFE28_02095 [Alphaproteobacteria bacterium PA2]